LQSVLPSIEIIEAELSALTGDILKDAQ